MWLKHRNRYLGMSMLLILGLDTSLCAQQSKNPPLPPGAVVIERASVPPTVHPDRGLMLWMIAPEKHQREESPSNPYTCPEVTQGSFYRGSTRISLVNTATQKIINTIRLKSGNGAGVKDSFDIPYRILADYYYTVPGHAKGSEGKPALLALHDVNGDGLPLEASFFEAEACMGLLTTTIGYSRKQDKVIQYEVEFKSTTQETVEGRGVAGAGKASVTTEVWVDYLFAKKPIKPGHWSFEIDYRGRGGSLDKYSVSYDPAREKFFGFLSRMGMPQAVQ